MVSKRWCFLGIPGILREFVGFNFRAMYENYHMVRLEGSDSIRTYHIEKLALCPAPLKARLRES